MTIVSKNNPVSLNKWSRVRYRTNRRKATCFGAQMFVQRAFILWNYKINTEKYICIREINQMRMEPAVMYYFTSGFVCFPSVCAVLPLPSASVDAVVCDLPFGKKFGTKTNMAANLPLILTEMERSVCLCVSCFL